MIRCIALTLSLLVGSISFAQSTEPVTYNIRDFGAIGDGKHLDSPAINRAIAAASDHGGGTVLFPAGEYRSTTIHLRSDIEIHLNAGATLIAAATDLKAGVSYDPPEPNPFDKYQDFGHSHWHNSLICGENLHDLSIVGPGAIDGSGLIRYAADSPRKSTTRAAGKFGYPSDADTVATGWGNKSIALKHCRNVLIRDITMRRGGHFAILLTGVDNCTLDNLKIDTNRDGIDLDCCRNARVSNCSVNSPFDDGICPKSSFALGELRATENLTITNCHVSGYVEGSMLDGTFRANDKDPATGRIKLGTESNGGFKNITISNCVFDHCHGLALEEVDGGTLENITIDNIAMRDIVGSPIFLRLGSRLRGPEGTKVGALRQVIISNVVVHNADPRYASIISGIPGGEIEDVSIKNIRIDSPGGGTKDQAERQLPERENAYPEPTMFGPTPAFAFFIRHVHGIEIGDVTMRSTKADARAAFLLDDVNGARFVQIDTPHAPDALTFILDNVHGFDLTGCVQTPDIHFSKQTNERF